MNQRTTRTGLLSLALLGVLLLSACATDDLKGCEPAQQPGIHYCLTKKPEPDKAKR